MPRPDDRPTGEMHTVRELHSRVVGHTRKDGGEREGDTFECVVAVVQHHDIPRLIEPSTEPAVEALARRSDCLDGHPTDASKRDPPAPVVSRLVSAAARSSNGAPESIEERTERLALLAIEGGVNLAPGQFLLVLGHPEHRPLVR